MSDDAALDRWSAGDSYELYMGRWSRQIATRFLDWCGAPDGGDWLDVGCGTGALSAQVLDKKSPDSLLGVDPSDGFVAHAAKTITDPRARFAVAGAEALPCKDDSLDSLVSGLCLNFVPDRTAALREFQRVVRPGGTIAIYVWDYPGGGMGFIDAFWRAAAVQDPAATEFDESSRFPFCTAEGLQETFSESGLQARVAPIEVRTVFPDFEAFWHPFTLGAGPAPGYLASREADAAEAIKAAARAELDSGGPVDLPARAWAIEATVA